MLFDRAIDSKLRACEWVKSCVRDIAHGVDWTPAGRAGIAGQNPGQINQANTPDTLHTSQEPESIIEVADV